MTTGSMLMASDVPRDVVLAAGAWLGAALQVDGFHWKQSSLCLQRNSAGLTHQVHFQPSKYNRTGKLIQVSTMLNVRDAALRRWRRTHVDRVTRQNDFVCGHLLGYASGRANGYLYGDATDGDIDLTDPNTREHRLRTFVTMLRNSVLPWFDEASDPEVIVASRAGDYTNDPVSLVEWLASRACLDLVTTYADRYLTRNRWARGPYSEGEAAANAGMRHPEVTTNVATNLGWSVATLIGP